jgi:hypothetical protein
VSMSGQDLADLRARNRAALGLSGLGDVGCCGCEPKGLGDLVSMIPGGIPAVGIETSFPPMEVAWAPGQSEPVTKEGPAWGDWLLRHVVRPVVNVGGVRVEPYRDAADYSALANILALLGLAGAVGGGVYVLSRAFGGGAR